MCQLCEGSPAIVHPNVDPENLSSCHIFWTRDTIYPSHGLLESYHSYDSPQHSTYREERLINLLTLLFISICIQHIQHIQHNCYVDVKRLSMALDKYHKAEQRNMHLINSRSMELYNDVIKQEKTIKNHLFYLLLNKIGFYLRYFLNAMPIYILRN